MAQPITRLNTKKAPIDNRFPHLRDTKPLTAHIDKMKGNGVLFTAKIQCKKSNTVSP